MFKRRTFTDRQLDAEFTKQGFVTVRLVDATDVRALLDVYERHHPADLGGYFVTLRDDDPANREVVSKAVVDVVRGPALALLTDHRIVVGTFVVKETSANSVKVPHLDPVLADEPRHRSIGIWMPLVDTNEANGMLWVLAGSHREAPTFRTASQPHHEWAETIVDRSPPDRRIGVPLEAGHAILYDHALVHWSGANRSGSTRVAAAAAALPKDQPAVSCWINGRGERERWAVPDEFRMMIGTPPRTIGRPMKVR